MGLDVASVRTDAEGRYSLTHRFWSVTPDCSTRIWDSTIHLEMYVEAEGYPLRQPSKGALRRVSTLLRHPDPSALLPAT